METALQDGMLVVNLNMIQALAAAVITYYFGAWVKSHTPVFKRYSVPSPVIGGMTLAIVLSILQGAGIMSVNFDPTLQKLLMLAFFTTIGLMASVKVVTQGGKLLVGFLAVVSVLSVLQNLLGMGIADLMGLDMHYGILAGSVSMMGGLGTSAAFGPYFEQTYNITGGTAVAITAATFGMVGSLVIGGPFGEWLIHKYKIQTPNQLPEPEPELHIPDDMETDIVEEKGHSLPSITEHLMQACGIVAICMALGTVLSDFLGQFITLPAYIGSMIIAAIVRNIADFTHKIQINVNALNAVADISLVMFVTMAVNSLKLHELVNLALPLIVILIAQTILVLVFFWAFIFLMFGRSYDTVMLSVGGLGFSMGATANGLAVMQALAEKYGSSPRAWLIVSLVGAFLIDLINALIITWMGTW